MSSDTYTRASSLLIKVFLPLLFLISGCTAHYPVNEKLTAVDNTKGYRTNTVTYDRSDELVVALAFSGGGTRAAALSYGVLQALRDTPITWDGRQRRLIDEIDTISSVSGGSFTAAYYGLFGDRIFEDFEEKFLKKDVQGELTGQLWNPVQWIKLGSPFYGRSEMAAEYYDEHIFEHKTFADLNAGNGPFVQINATDITNGTQFIFTQGIFDAFCSDLDSFTIGRAVAASSAVPILFSSLTINSYAGSCDYELPGFMKQALAVNDRTSRRYHLAKKYAAYMDFDKKPYIHLLDGGLTDNLGVRVFINRFALFDDYWSVIKFSNKKNIRRLLVIVVNAQSELNLTTARLKTGISLIDTILGASKIPLNEYSFETMATLRYLLNEFDEGIVKSRCEERANNLQPLEGCDDIAHYLVEVNLDQLEDEIERTKLKHLPTSFRLKPDEIDALANAAKSIVYNSAEFQQFRQDIQ